MINRFIKKVIQTSTHGLHIQNLAIMIFDRHEGQTSRRRMYIFVDRWILALSCKCVYIVKNNIK